MADGIPLSSARAERGRASEALGDAALPVGAGAADPGRRESALHHAKGLAGSTADRLADHRTDQSADQSADHFGDHPIDHVAGPAPDRCPEESMLEDLDRRERLRLVEFVCSFAWADLEIQPEERVFIARLIRRLGLDEEEDLQVQQWLERPPRLDDLDPTSIPPAHRRLFVEAVEGLIAADGEISDEERDSFEIFKQLLGD